MKRDTKFLIISSVISLVISIVVTALFSQYAVLVFANLGIESSIMKLADESREYGSYDIAIKMYKKIADKNNEYSPYANAALGEIYSGNAVEKDYKKAVEYYEKSISESSDPIILNSCLNFVVRAWYETKNEVDYSELVFDILSDKNVDFVLTLLNKYIETESGVFEEIGIKSELMKEDVTSILEGKTISVAKTEWKYDYTKYDKNGTLGYVNDNEKLLLVDQWEELISETSFSTVTVYKYYHYTGTKTEVEVDVMNYVSDLTKGVENIYLTQIDMKNKEEIQK